MTRSLTPDERGALDLLLGVEFDGVDELRAQSATVLSSGPSCSCGCGSIALVVEPTAPPSTASSPIPHELTVIEVDGSPVGGILLFLENGKLAELEHYYFDDGLAPGFPPLWRLKSDL
jgi:hypothetical protein